MNIRLKAEKYPLLSIGDMLGKGINFRILSPNLLFFRGRGFWHLDNLNEEGIPQYSYRIFRSTDTTEFDFEAESDIEDSEFQMFFVKDLSDSQYKYLVASTQEVPELYYVLSSLSDVTEYALKIQKAAPSISGDIHVMPAPSLDVSILLPEDEDLINKVVAQHFKQISSRYLKTMQTRSVQELTIQDSKQLTH